MKTRRVSSGIALISLIAGTLCASAQEPQVRTINRLPIEKKEPLSIVKVEVNGQPVSVIKGFVSDDDWLRSLVISVKNKSDKLILFASIQLQFPRATGPQDRFSIAEMSHGNRALPMRPPTEDERQVGIPPGETVEVRLSVQEFVDLRKFLTATGYPANIEKVDFRINEVIFCDDTMWTRGSYCRRDHSDPGTWINLDSVER